MFLYSLPFISAVIGWVVAWLAVSLFFNSVLPKRLPQLALQIGDWVAKELINFGDIASKLKDPKQLEAVTPLIESHIDTFLRVKLQEKIPVVAMFIGENTIDKLKDGMMEEITSLLPQVIGKYADGLTEKMDIGATVTKKLTTLQTSIIQKALKKELSYLYILGAVIGAIVGCLQLLLMQL